MSPALPGYEQAAAIVAARIEQLRPSRRPTERVDLARAADRILAQPLIADRDQPPFARSTRDGYACRASEASSHLPLALIGSSRAGDSPAGPLPPRAAWEIMTGAPVPESADAVVMLEHVEAAHSQVRLLPPRTVKSGDNIVSKGVQAREGDELLPAGTQIQFGQIALAASCGYTALEVFARPRVAILTTGDELAPIESSPGPGQIRNSNAPMLAAMVAAAGGDPLVLPTAADNAQSLDSALAQAAGADMLLISGGVSAGKFDLVEPALARASARFHFTGVRIQPGKPLVFGELPHGEADPLPFFGLPGNPISSAVTFLLFGASVLAALAGSVEIGPRFSLARLARDVHGKHDLTRFVPAYCTFFARSGGARPGEVRFSSGRSGSRASWSQPEVFPVGMQGSGDLPAYARSNCFLVLPEGTADHEAGSIVRILLQ